MSLSMDEQVYEWLINCNDDAAAEYRPKCSAKFLAGKTLQAREFMAVWVPLIFGTLRKPAEQPTSAPRASSLRDARTE